MFYNLLMQSGSNAVNYTQMCFIQYGYTIFVYIVWLYNMQCSFFLLNHALLNLKDGRMSESSVGKKNIEWGT